MTSSISLVRATTEVRTPGHRLSVNRGTSSRSPGTRATRVAVAYGHVRNARASGSLKSRRCSGRSDSSARNNALCSAVRLAWPSRMLAFLSPAANAPYSSVSREIRNRAG